MDFHCNKTSDSKTAKHFFKKTLQSFYDSNFHVVAVDKNIVYPMTIEQLNSEKRMLAGLDENNKNGICVIFHYEFSIILVIRQIEK
ncbi:hypothetical protein [Bacillus nitratireducens]|uniref:hypothetical protein n=1 Tax=Bacillus nitratireducens TaxID=2026193 RepID=UPI001142D1BB|nr:hypothetical protein [Bacillus nitratireducens]MDR4170973.1 hypothetical protein [Bacillus nitratireducens]